MALKKKTAALVIPAVRIAASIYLLRGKKIIFDFDLAVLYEIPTKVLNQAVSRNLTRFPEDFMFRLSRKELAELNRSQIVTSPAILLKHRDPNFAPRAFTQEGVAMLSGVLKSKRAIAVNIGIMRAFVRMGEFLASNEELTRKVDKHDRDILVLFEHIQNMLEPAAPEPEPKKRQLGFGQPKPPSSSQEVPPPPEQPAVASPPRAERTAKRGSKRSLSQTAA